MRELGPVKEPEDEKAPKKKSLKGGFLASWMRRENSGEPDGKLDEQDLVDPEQDALFNDGFSKRWHKLFSGTMPVDDTVAADDNATNVTSDDSTSKPIAITDKTKTDKPLDKSQADQDLDTASLMDAARKQVEQAAKSADELKGEVEEQHDADRLTNKEITAMVPSAASDDTAAAVEYKSAEDEDFDVFSDDKPKSSKKDTPKKPTLQYEDMESTPETKNDLPPLKDNADSKAINVNPMHRDDPFPRIDPREFAHQSDVEDNVEAPGAPTKGYRGLLVVDHPDRPASPQAVPSTPPPSLPPQPEAFLPQATPPSTTPDSGMPATSPSYVLPPKKAEKWPNPAYSRPVAGGSYSGPKLDRHIQALIDRPVSAEMSQLVDSLSALNRLKSDSEITAGSTMSTATQLTADENVVIPKTDTSLSTQQNKTTDSDLAVDTMVKQENKPSVSDEQPTEKPKHTEGATPLAEIIKDSALAEKVAAADTKPKPVESPKVSEAPVMPIISTEPAVPTTKPAPAPLYIPPAPKTLPVNPVAQPSPRLNLPVLAQPSLYQLAVKRGILGGLAVSGAVIAAYLFG